jgi:hypothetical protein
MDKQLKKEAEKCAMQQETTLQKLFNDALSDYLGSINTKKAEKIVFHSINLGVPLDNLTRDDIYGKPELP